MRTEPDHDRQDLPSHRDPQPVPRRAPVPLGRRDPDGDFILVARCWLREGARVSVRYETEDQFAFLEETTATT